MKSIMTFFAVAAVCAFSSCGTAKKLEAANAEIQKLNGEISDKNNQLSANATQISQLKTENLQYSKEAEYCREVKAALIRKKENLDKSLAARGTSLEEIEAKAETAVRKFEEAGCTVTYKNGRFHVIVPDSFSYHTGSYTIGARGREALNVVAQVMYDNPGIQTMVVGHTDTIPVKGNADNWALSANRALAVVRILEDVYNINPRRLTIAGKSKFRPVANNDTAEGRAKNRRIEFIINPDLDRLWDLADEN